MQQHGKYQCKGYRMMSSYAVNVRGDKLLIIAEQFLKFF